MANLRVVDMSHNKIRTLPDGLFFGEGLEILDLSDNDMNRMPLASMSFGSASTLCELDLSNNDIASIPNGDLFSRFKVCWQILFMMEQFPFHIGLFSVTTHIESIPQQINAVG